MSKAVLKPVECEVLKVSDNGELLAYLITDGQGWVSEERDLHRPGAIPLDPQARSQFVLFFEDAVLDGARFKAVPTINNPGFYRDLEAKGYEIPLDFTSMHGITFVDTILLSQRFQQSWSPALLFHELVHVVQYQSLGIAEFVTRYINGWAENSYQYRAIPLEHDAYELQARYEARPTEPFSVAEEVSRRLGH